MRTLKGSGEPLAARCSAKAEPARMLVYSSRSSASRVPRVPRLSASMSSAPTLTPPRELVQSNLVRLEASATRGRAASGAVRADRRLVLPPVPGNKVATGVADGGYAELAHQIHHVGPESVRVADG